VKLAFEIPEQPYSGRIGEVTVGTGPNAFKVGGEDSYPFHLFEGSIPNAPKIAMEIWDYDPSEEWPAAALEPFKDVISSPDEWARKCVDEYGAEMIVLQVKSTDPNAMDRGAEEAAEVVRKVLDAIEVPVAVWGTGNNQKDEEVLKKISETCEGKNLSLSPVEEACHKGVGASALGYGHNIVASSPIDVNLAKQLNILLGNLGVQLDKILVDPTTGGLGYGLEYSYSVMERIRMAALTQETIQEAPTLGDPEKRGILMETVSAVCYLLSGANVVVLRHPESVRLTRSFIDLMINGGVASDVEEISKRLELQEADLVSLSPEPDLTIAEEEAKPTPKAVKEEEKPKAAQKPEEKVVELKPKLEEERRAKAEEEAVAKAKAEEEARAKEKTEARAKAEEEAEARADAEAREKAEEEVRAKAEAEAKVKAQEEARRAAEAKAKEKDELQELRYKRALEREKLEAQREVHEAEAVSKTPAAVQLELVDRLIHNLDRIHRRK
jgi:acetyl-CoA decarbonylase/synthase complex subunit delta